MKQFFIFFLLMVTLSAISCQKVMRTDFTLSTHYVEIPQTGGTAVVDCDMLIQLEDIDFSNDKTQWQCLDNVDENLDEIIIDYRLIEIKSDYLNAKIIQSEVGECAISVTLPENTSSLPIYYRVCVTHGHATWDSFIVYQAAKE